MKKFIVPIVLLVLAVALVIYLRGGLFVSGNSFDPEAYLVARAKVDSLEVALWDAQGNPEGQREIREELDASWEALVVMRNNSPKTFDENSPENQGVLAPDTLPWIVGGAFAVVLCFVILIFVLKRRKEYLTRQMEVLKTSEQSVVPASEPEMTFTPPQPRPKRTSIIADAEAYAARKRETLMQQSQPKADATPAVPVANAAPVESKEEQKVAFEDENGVPENKILTETPGSKPTLRPTARERITSAMKNLSDVLRAPRGLSRDRTMKLRAQSRNSTGDPSLGGSNPLETSRFDREANEKMKILQLSRRGFPASAIASTLKIPQEKVESIIKDSLG